MKTHSIIIMDTVNSNNYFKNIDIPQVPMDAKKAYICIDSFQAFISNATNTAPVIPGSMAVRISSAANVYTNIENNIANSQTVSVFSSNKYTQGTVISGQQFYNLYFNEINNIENWIELKDFKNINISFEQHAAFFKILFSERNFPFVLSLRLKFE